MSKYITSYYYCKNNRIFYHVTWPICSSTSLHICHIILTLLIPQVHYISNGFLGLLWQMMSSESRRTMTLSLSLLYHIVWWVASIKLISPCWCFEIINSGDLEKFHKCWLSHVYSCLICSAFFGGPVLFLALFSSPLFASNFFIH